jgi:hypothetical protein
MTMKTMTAMPQAVTITCTRHAAPSMRVRPTFATMPSMAALSGHDCRWSHKANAFAIRTGLKAYGSRRLGETST